MKIQNNQIRTSDDLETCLVSLICWWCLLGWSTWYRNKARQTDKDFEDKFGDNQSDDFLEKNDLVSHSLWPPNSHKSIAPATIKWGQVIRSAALVMQNHLSKPEDLMLQNTTPLRKSAPWPPNSSDEYVSCTAPARRKTSCQRSSAYGPRLDKTLTFCSLLTRCIIPCACHAKRHLNVQKCSESVSFLHFWLRNVRRATTACTFSTSQLLKVVRTWWFLCILASKCASRHNGVHFFDITTSKKVVRSWCALYILTWKCTSRHNGVQLFISHLTTWIRTRCFSEPTFRPSGATNPPTPLWRWRRAYWGATATLNAQWHLLI